MTSKTRPNLARAIGEILESMAQLFERKGQSEDPSHRLTRGITCQRLTARRILAGARFAGTGACRTPPSRRRCTGMD